MRGKDTKIRRRSDKRKLFQYACQLLKSGAQPVSCIFLFRD